jgi:Mechanosensitive ion channel, conserved TM helix
MDQLRTWGEQLLAALGETVQTLIAYLPTVLIAAGLLILGWLLARFSRSVTVRTIGSLDWLFSRMTARSTETARVFRVAATQTVAAIVFWVVLLVFATAALRTLGGPWLEGWTQNLISYLPRLVGGIMIMLLGFVGGALLRHLVEHAAAGVGIAQSTLFGRLTQIVVVVSGLIIGVGELGVDVTFPTHLLTVTVGAALGGIALVMALGTRQHLANLVGTRYLRKYYSIGDHVRVGVHRGRILEIADGCIFLETDEGDVSIPGRYFTREPFLKIKGGPDIDQP